MEKNASLMFIIRLQYIFCQIRIAHNFVSGMVDQPFVDIIYIYKLFFFALIVKNS